MHQPQANTVIKLDNVSKAYKIRQNKHVISGIFNPDWKHFTAVDDLSFEIHKNESVAFLGPNGAGKTTTIKMLSGLLFPTEGTIDVLGHTPQNREADFLTNIGLVMGNKAGLNWDLTANQSFDLLRRIYELNIEDFEESLLELTELLKVGKILDRQIRQMSLGERMKVELIGAVLHRPKVLFLDEPTIGLDVDAKLAVRDFVRFLQRERNTTVLLTSHDMLDVAHICDRAIIINNGQKVYDNKLSTLESKYANIKYVEIYASQSFDIDSLQKVSNNITSLKEGHWRVETSKENIKHTINVLLSSDVVDDFKVESVSLDRIMQDVFNETS